MASEKTWKLAREIVNIVFVHSRQVYEGRDTELIRAIAAALDASNHDVNDGEPGVGQSKSMWFAKLLIDHAVRENQLNKMVALLLEDLARMTLEIDQLEMQKEKL